MRDGIYKKKLDDLLAVCHKNLRTVNDELIRHAFDFSLTAHKQDLRASGEPYFNHPYEVALIVAKEIPLDDISVAAALLHDVAEDTDYEVICVSNRIILYCCAVTTAIYDKTSIAKTNFRSPF